MHLLLATTLVSENKCYGFKVYKKGFNQQTKYKTYVKLTKSVSENFVVYNVMSLPQLAILFSCSQSIIQWMLVNENVLPL